MKYTTETIEDLLAVSITQLKQLGYLRPDALKTGVVEWRENGEIKAAALVTTDTRPEVATVRFTYDYKGLRVDYSAPLRFTPSNLNRGGYYYFVCPNTGRSCRKLFLVGGRFVSRYAFRALYRVQTRSRAERSGRWGYLDAVCNFDEQLHQRGRKTYYRGNITPYGRRLQRLADKCDNLAAQYEAKQRVGG